MRELTLMAAVGLGACTGPPSTATIPADVPALSAAQQFEADFDFQYITDIEMRGNETYVTDYGEGSVLVFDASGQLDRKISGAGPGPAELAGGKLIAVAPDTLYVLTVGGIKAFSPLGALLNVDQMNVGNFTGFDHTDHGLVIIRKLSNPQLRFDRDTTRLEIVGRGYGFWQLREKWYDWQTAALPAPLAPVPAFAIAPDGLVYSAEGERFEIRVTTLMGDSVGRIAADTWPIMATAGDRRRATDAMLDQHFAVLTATGTDPRRLLLRLREPRRMPRPGEWPAVGRLLADRGGRLLVERPGLHAWDLVVKGGVEGRVSFPDGFVPWMFRGQSAVGVLTDSSGTQSIVGYELEKGGATP